jgi:ACR3 family arsenite efflux pump ArsB
MKETKSKAFVPIVMFFIALNAFLIAGRNILERWGADQQVLLIGHTLIFIISFISFRIALRGLNNPNPNVFVRSVMGSIMIKMFVLVILAFIYISIYKKDINKPALFGCMGLYLVYTFMEVAALTRLLKRKANG